jgi:hypothetical protein
MSNTNFPVVKNHRILQNAPQFKPIRRGAREKGVVRQYFSKDKKQSLKIKLFKEVDIADQDLFLCLLAIGLVEKRGSIFDPEKKESDLWTDLNTKGKAAKSQAIYIETTRYELLKEINRTYQTKNRKWLMESLERLNGISFTYENTEEIWGFNFVSYFVNKKTDKIEILINPLSAAVMLGDIRSFAFIHRGERQELKMDVSKALHSILSGLVSFGEKRSINIDVLAHKIWADYDDKVTDSGMRDRRTSIKKAIREINALENWEIVIAGKGGHSSLVARRKGKRGGGY